MFHHHLPLLLSRAAIYGRHAVDLYRSAVELAVVNLRLSIPVGKRRIGLRKLSSDPTAQRAFRKKRRRKVPLLIHYHIFKNAGTSFEYALQQALAGGYRSFDSASAGGYISAHDFVEFSFQNPKVTAISSHQASPPPPRIFGRDVLTSILIRDPIARIRSIYTFERGQQGTSPGALKAKELDFKGYVEWRLETSPALLCNFQVYFCARTRNDRAFIPGPDHLQRAIGNLDDISIVGTVARYEEWLALAQKILAGPFPNLILPFSRQNVSPESDRTEAAVLKRLTSELGEATAHRLLESNQLDMCLHQIADALLTRRLAEHGVELRLLKAYTKARSDRPSSHRLPKIG